MNVRAFILVCATLAVAPALAHAQAGDSLGANWRADQQNEARSGVRRGQYLPLSRVLETIARRTPGRQLDAGLEAGPGGRMVYRVRWATAGGKRIDYLVDAESGAIVSASGQ